MNKPSSSSKSITSIMLPVGAIAILLLMVAWMAGAFRDKITPGTFQQQISQVNGVRVEKIERVISESVPATIEAKQATIISSRLLSRVVKVHVRAGDSVTKNQLLVELEQKDLSTRVAQSKAKVNSIGARLKEAEQALVRAQELTATGVMPTAQLDKAQAQRDSAEADLEAAKQALHEANTTSEFANIRAPIDGKITDRYTEPGDTVQPGSRLLGLYNPLSLRAEANIRETIALTMRIGQKLSVEIPTINTTLDAEIEEIVPAGNAGSRSFLVKFRLNATQGLLPGMYARAEIPAGRDTALVIPKHLVAHVGQLDIVWVKNKSGVIEKVFIQTGKSHGNDLVEVISGLNAGDIVVPVGEKSSFSPTQIK
ncbi:MAG: efflux RND transporter periplasmic adaptor subunit [Agarilytica sp.]